MVNLTEKQANEWLESRNAKVSFFDLERSKKMLIVWKLEGYGALQSTTNANEGVAHAVSCAIAVEKCKLANLENGSENEQKENN